jgi:hypothetical protein
VRTGASRRAKDRSRPLGIASPPVRRPWTAAVKAPAAGPWLAVCQGWPGLRWVAGAVWTGQESRLPRRTGALG